MDPRLREDDGRGGFDFCDTLLRRKDDGTFQATASLFLNNRSLDTLTLLHCSGIDRTAARPVGTHYLQNQVVNITNKPVSN